MKNLGKFLNEKKEDDQQPRPLKKGEGADDKEFLTLTSEYKVARRSDKERAAELFNQLEELREKGDVSQKAKLAAAYL